MSPLTTRTIRVLLPVLLSSATALSPASQQSIAISPGVNVEVETLFSDPNPEPEWDVVGLNLGGTGFSALVRNDDASNPGRLSQLAVLGKDLFEELIMDEYGVQQTTTGNLGALLSSGTLGAFEIDIFDDQFDPTYDPTPDPVLGTDALADWVELTFQGSHVGYLYLYDAALYGARKASLGAVEITVWPGDLIHTGGGANRSVNVLGNDNVFRGSVRSSGGMRIGGFSQSFDAEVFWAKGFLNLSPGAASFAAVPLKDPAAALRPTPQSATWYRTQPNSLSFTVDLTLQDDGQGNLVVSDGVQTFPAEGMIVNTTGSIDIDGVGLSGSVTLIADGEVNLSGTACQLTPASTDLLAWATGAVGGDIMLDGGGNVLSGSLFAPASFVRIPGSNNTLTGQISAKSFKITGGFNVIGDGAH